MRFYFLILSFIMFSTVYAAQQAEADAAHIQALAAGDSYGFSEQLERSAAEQYLITIDNRCGALLLVRPISRRAYVCCNNHTTLEVTVLPDEQVVFKVIKAGIHPTEYVLKSIPSAEEVAVEHFSTLRLMPGVRYVIHQYEQKKAAAGLSVDFDITMVMPDGLPHRALWSLFTANDPRAYDDE